LTLSAIGKRMGKSRQDDLPVTLHHPFFGSYRSGKAFVEIPEISIRQLELSLDAETQDSLLRQILESSRKVKEKSVKHKTHRRVTDWQMSGVLHTLSSMVSLTQSLIDQFVPRQYPHSLLRRCWGVFQEMHGVSLIL
jgi:hypothetical protein